MRRLSAHHGDATITRAQFRLTGSIDEVAIYSQALSGETIAKHYANGVQGLGYCNLSSVGPIAQWKFDEGSGTDAQDAAGSNDGTISGATWTTDSVSGTSLHFDGTGQVILPSSNTFIPVAKYPDNHIRLVQGRRHKLRRQS